MLPDTLTKLFFLENQECLFREDTVFYRVWVFLFHQRDLTDKHTWPVVLKKRHRLVRQCLVRDILKTLSEILKNLGKPTANFIPMFCKQRIEWIIGRVGTYSSWNSWTTRQCLCRPVFFFCFARVLLRCFKMKKEKNNSLETESCTLCKLVFPCAWIMRTACYTKYYQRQATQRIIWNVRQILK